jgi:hypothetical protein
MSEANGGFEPRVVGFLCNWCSYAGADKAGAAQTPYPPGVRFVRVMCSGRVDRRLPLQGGQLPGHSAPSNVAEAAAAVGHSRGALPAGFRFGRGGREVCPRGHGKPRGVEGARPAGGKFGAVANHGTLKPNWIRRGYTPLPVQLVPAAV